MERGRGMSSSPSVIRVYGDVLDYLCTRREKPRNNGTRLLTPRPSSRNFQSAL